MSPWTDGTGGGYVCPPESPQRETGRRGGGRREDCCAIRRSSDRSGSPKPRQRVRRRLAGAPAAACRSRA
ncbi:hypothetical protein [Escherichia coli]|uniref:hypothetical protein n=1 Tax=Escherichia coli TaxID=562 RepID=UPI003D9C9A62